jgi:hypothetical protein
MHGTNCSTSISNYNEPEKITAGKKGTVVWLMEAAQIWRGRYDRKKNVQSSGRLCFSAGSNYNRKKLRPKKNKCTVESSDRPFFPADSNNNQKKITTGKIKGTVVWPMKLAQIWRERYDRKKTYSRLAGYVFQRVQITTGKNYNQKKNRYSRLAVIWKLEIITSRKKGQLSFDFLHNTYWVS